MGHLTETHRDTGAVSAWINLSEEKEGITGRIMLLRVVDMVYLCDTEQRCTRWDDGTLLEIVY